MNRKREILSGIGFGILGSVALCVFIWALATVLGHFQLPIHYHASYLAFTCSRGGCEIDRTKVFVELFDGRYAFTPENVSTMQNKLGDRGVIKDFVSDKLVIELNQPMDKIQVRNLLYEIIYSMEETNWTQTKGEHHPFNGNFPPDVIIY